MYLKFPRYLKLETKEICIIKQMLNKFIMIWVQNTIFFHGNFFNFDVRNSVLYSLTYTKIQYYTQSYFVFKEGEPKIIVRDYSISRTTGQVTSTSTLKPPTVQYETNFFQFEVQHSFSMVCGTKHIFKIIILKLHLGHIRLYYVIIILS